MPERNDRSNLGEQADMSETSVERQDRSMGASSTDESTGSEGVEEQPIRRSEPSRRGSRQQGRENTDNNAESFSGQGGQKENEEAEEGTGYI
jgi:hypothetical protein